MWGCKYDESWSPVCVEEYMYFFGGTNWKKQLQERNQVQPPQETQRKNWRGVEEYMEGHNLRLLRETPAITRDLTNLTKNKKVRSKNKNPSIYKPYPLLPQP